MSFSQSFALKALAAAAVAAVSGCGDPDPAKEFAAGSRAFELKDWERARRHYEAGLEADAENVDALLTMAQIEFASGTQSKADEYLARAAAKAGDDPDVIELAAQFAYHSKNYDLAKKMYRRLADDDTLDAKYRSKGWAGLGVIDYLLGDSAKTQSESFRIAAFAPSARRRLPTLPA